MIATVSGMVSSGVVSKLPPSVRDFQIYRFVKFECNSTREAALEFEISQTRVRQVIARVIEFLLESAPQGTDEERPAAGRHVAEQLAREQLEYLYQRAMKAFDDTYREDADGNLLPGKIAYLAAAARITMWMATVPVHGLPAFREDEEEFDAAAQFENVEIDHNDPEVQRIKQRMLDALDQAEAKVAAAQEAARIKEALPPMAEYYKTQSIRDCSVGALSRGELALDETEQKVVNTTAAETYKTMDEIKAEARRKFLRPAHLAQCESTVTPQSGGLPSPTDAEDHLPKPLSRKERRARERQRQRLLAKG